MEAPLQDGTTYAARAAARPRAGIHAKETKLNRHTVINTMATGIVASVLVFAAACLAEDEGDEPTPQAEDAVIHQTDEPPPTPEEVVEIRKNVVASLEVLSGHVEIFSVGPADDPQYAYAVVGGPSVRSIFEQLWNHDPTAAEVFLALSGAADPIPEVLLRDHAAQSANRNHLNPEPRKLEYQSFRNIELDDLDCHGSGGNHQSFASWVDEWETDFSNWWSGGNHWSHLNTSPSSTTYYTINVTTTALAMSTCNARLTASGSDTTVFFWWWYPLPLPAGQWIPAHSFSLDDFEAVHFYLPPGSWPSDKVRMSVAHSGPQTPRSYVAYGYCTASC